MVTFQKIDLQKSSISKISKLNDVVTETCADRVCVISENRDINTLLRYRGEFVGIKAPGLDGTEIWIIQADLQEDYEKSCGFTKKSTPVVKLNSKEIGLLLEK